jgi:hypothetical protein
MVLVWKGGHTPASASKRCIWITFISLFQSLRVYASIITSRYWYYEYQNELRCHNTFLAVQHCMIYTSYDQHIGHSPSKEKGSCITHCVKKHVGDEKHYKWVVAGFPAVATKIHVPPMLMLVGHNGHMYLEQIVFNVEPHQNIVISPKAHCLGLL